MLTLQTEQTREERENPEVKIRRLMIELGIPAHLRGYAYIRAAVRMGMVDHSKVYSITKNIYPEIARTYQTTSAKVERAIRNAIEVSWERGNDEVFTELFGYDSKSGRKRPTNSMYIAALVEKIQLDNSI